MLKISKKLSVVISISLCAVFFLALLASAVAMPFVSGALPFISERISKNIALFYALFYLAYVPMLTACVFIFILLSEINAGRVFTDKTVFTLRVISWCCFAACLVFALLGVFFFISFVAMAAAALFLGFILRVVKNMLEEAVSLKAENDLTI